MATITRDAARAALTGPVASLRVPFRRDGDLDIAGLRRAVAFDLDAGSRTILQTYGDSLHSLLTDAEVGEVTRLVVEETAGRALVVAADRQWATPREVAFAREMRALGADVLMVLPPDWGASCTEDSLVAHYAAVAAEIPVMAVTGLFLSRGHALGLRVIERLLEVPGVVAVKDDVCGEFGRRLGLLAHGTLGLLSGGQKQNHLDMHPYGCDSYLSTFLTFRPEVAHAYWEAVTGQDLPRAREIIARVDLPFFDAILGLPGGFDAGIHGVLELAGICGRWRRPPYHSLTDAELAQLRDALASLPAMLPQGSQISRLSGE